MKIRRETRRVTHIMHNRHASTKQLELYETLKTHNALLCKLIHEIMEASLSDSARRDSLWGIPLLNYLEKCAEGIWWLQWLIIPVLRMKMNLSLKYNIETANRLLGSTGMLHKRTMVHKLWVQSLYSRELMNATYSAQRRGWRLRCKRSLAMKGYDVDLQEYITTAWLEAWRRLA